MNGDTLARLNTNLLDGMGIINQQQQSIIITRVRRFLQGASQPPVSPDYEVNSLSALHTADSSATNLPGERVLYQGNGLVRCRCQQLDPIAWVEVVLFETIACGHFGKCWCKMSDDKM